MSDPFYGTADDFKGYWNDRGNAVMGAEDDATINAALLVVSQYLDLAFMSQFMGLKVGGRDQIREWPRNGVQDIYGYYVPNTAIPREVLNATYEAAQRQITTPGVFFKDYTRSIYKQVNISGAVAAVFAIGTAYDFQTEMPALSAILNPVLTGAGTGRMSALSGASSRT